MGRIIQDVFISLNCNSAWSFGVGGEEKGSRREAYGCRYISINEL